LDYKTLLPLGLLSLILIALRTPSRSFADNPNPASVLPLLFLLPIYRIYQTLFPFLLHSPSWSQSHYLSALPPSLERQNRLENIYLHFPQGTNKQWPPLGFIPDSNSVRRFLFRVGQWVCAAVTSAVSSLILLADFV